MYRHVNSNPKQNIKEALRHPTDLEMHLKIVKLIYDQIYFKSCFTQLAKCGIVLQTHVHGKNPSILELSMHKNTKASYILSKVLANCVKRDPI